MDGIIQSIDIFINEQKSKVESGYNESPNDIILCIKEVISMCSLHSEKEACDLLWVLTFMGKKLNQNLPLAISLTNIVRRALNIIRVEYKNAGLDLSEETSHSLAFSILRLRKSSSEAPPDIDFEGAKSAILLGVDDLRDELNEHIEMISEQATQYIQPHDVILTYGKSSTVLKFLEQASSDRVFEVLVAEGAPQCRGHLMAKLLAECGIKTTLISDNSVYVLMSRVNKVIVGTQALMANGGLITASGIHGVCLAAQVHSVPVLVTCGLYKLCPLYPFDQDTFNETLSPALIAEMPTCETVEFTTFSVPALDYIGADLVSLYITDAGSHNSTYLYRLLSEYYSQEDYELSSK